MYFRSNNEIFDDLTKAIAWFQHIGVATEGTRLQAIHHYLFDLLNFPADPEAAIPDIDHYSIISDASGFAMIANEFTKLPSNVLPRRALKEALYGPLCPSNEDTQSSDARNKFFELELAAQFATAGLAITGFDDVKIEFEQHRYIIECKRPFVGHRFETNLNKAYAQMQKRLRHRNDRAFVAIAIEKMFALDGSVHEIDSAAQARAFMESQIDLLQPRLIANGTTPDARIVGAVFISRFFMQTKTEGLKANNYLVGALPFRYAGLDTEEPSRLIRLTETLQQKFRAMDTGIQ